MFHDRRIPPLRPEPPKSDSLAPIAVAVLACLGMLTIVAFMIMAMR